MIGNEKNDPPLIVSTSSRGGNTVDSAQFNSFTASRENNSHFRQKSSLNTTRSAKPAVDRFLDDKNYKMRHLKGRQMSITNLKNPQFIDEKNEYLKYLNVDNNQSESQQQADTSQYIIS